MTKKQFALSQIEEYIKDPSKCGSDGTQCMNLTSSGKMCVAGKNYLPEVIKEHAKAGFEIISDDYHGDQSKFLIPSSVGILSSDEWGWLQGVHDCIASGQIGDTITEHGKYRIEMPHALFTYEELIALKN